MKTITTAQVEKIKTKINKNQWLEGIDESNLIKFFTSIFKPTYYWEDADSYIWRLKDGSYLCVPVPFVLNRKEGEAPKPIWI